MIRSSLLRLRDHAPHATNREESDMLNPFITAGEYVERIRLEQNGPDVDHIRPRSAVGFEEEQRIRTLIRIQKKELACIKVSTSKSSQPWANALAVASRISITEPRAVD